VVAEGRFAFIEKMVDKFVLSWEELIYGKIATKLEEIWGNQLKS